MSIDVRPLRLEQGLAAPATPARCYGAGDRRWHGANHETHHRPRAHRPRGNSVLNATGAPCRTNPSFAPEFLLARPSSSLAAAAASAVVLRMSSLRSGPGWRSGAAA